MELADKYNLSSIAWWIMSEVAFNLTDILNDVERSDSFKSLPFNCMKDENEVTKDERNKIADIFDFEDFTREVINSSTVKTSKSKISGLYPSLKIDQRVLEIVKKKDLKIKEQDLKIKEKDLKIKEQEIRK